MVSERLTLDEAKSLLNTCERAELQDHAFGDAEVASGYFGGTENSVTIGTTDSSCTFRGEDASALRRCGTIGRVERNDSTGPDSYREGECMRGLTFEGVAE